MAADPEATAGMMPGPWLPYPALPGRLLGTALAWIKVDIREACRIGALACGEVRGYSTVPTARFGKTPEEKAILHFARWLVRGPGTPEDAALRILTLFHACGAASAETRHDDILRIADCNYKWFTGGII